MTAGEEYTSPPVWRCILHYAAELELKHRKYCFNFVEAEEGSGYSGTLFELKKARIINLIGFITAKYTAQSVYPLLF